MRAVQIKSLVQSLGLVLCTLDRVEHLVVHCGGAETGIEAETARRHVLVMWVSCYHLQRLLA